MTALTSLPRLTTLIVSLVVALSSGTNYLYSAYAPQLGARLNINHTQLNIIGLAGNLGVYSTGPIWGRIVDRRGPRILLASGFILLLLGYLGIRYLFHNGAPGTGNSTVLISATSFYSLILLNWMTGAGGNAGLTSGVNSTAKTFPDRARATTTAIVLSGFGLSAFLFSSIAHVAYSGDTSAFLLLLALGTSIPMIFGFIFIRAIPLPATEDDVDGDVAEHGVLDASAVVITDTGVMSPLLDNRDGTASPAFRGHHHRADVELSPSSHGSRRSSRSLSSQASSKLSQYSRPNVYGRALWKSSDFWLLVTILSLLSGSGIMYINNVGSMSQALFAHSSVPYNDLVASQWQATQVSAISIMNFSGRIIIGLLSDYTKNRLGLPRAFCLVLVSSMFLISQIATANIDGIQNLWRASALVGLAYGGVFGLFPTMCIEWFGLAHFSENWGYMQIGPVLGGNIFSVAFGRNLDAHETRSETPAAVAIANAAVAATLSNTTHIPNAPAAHQCLSGLECYVDSIYVTIGACLLALLLSAWAGWRDWRKPVLASGTGRTHVVWENEEGDA